MAYHSAKGRIALRRGRVSIPGAEYFLTICTDGRRIGLTGPAAATKIMDEVRAMDSDATWQLRCATVMPDHVHLLVILGERLSLGKAVARLKAKTKTAFATAGSDLGWERDFFDHHVRPDEDRLLLFLYVYLNPYRAKLCPVDERWPWFYCRLEDWAWFKDLLDTECPIPEWLA